MGVTALLLGGRVKEEDSIEQAGRTEERGCYSEDGGEEVQTRNNEPII